MYEAGLARIQAAAFSELSARVGQVILKEYPAKSVGALAYDLGTGAGLLACGLVEAGYRVIAYDLSSDLLELARQNCREASFRKASIHDIDFEPCSMICAVGEVLSYHTRDEPAEQRLISLFERASQALTRGGHLLFDLIDDVGASIDRRAYLQSESWLLAYETRELPEERRLVREIDTFFLRADGAYERHHEVHEVRLFSRDWILSQLDRVGFSTRASASYGAVALPPRRTAYFAERR